MLNRILFNTFKDSKLELFILSVIVFIVGYVSFQFSVSEQLAGFSDDSAIYLIMAKVFSPLQNILDSELKSYHHYHLPPGFPFVLALFNGGNNLYISHCIVAFQALLSCIVFFYFSKNTIGTFKAFLALLIFICAPGFWLQMLKIGSEYQYIVLSLLFFILYDVIKHKQNKKLGKPILLGIVLAFCFLTRSIGLSLVIAFIIFSIISPKQEVRLREVIVFFVGLLLPIIIWKVVQPEKVHSYAEDLFLFLKSTEPLISLFNVISTNLIAIYKGIVNNFSFVFLDNSKYSELFMALVICFAIIGLMIRIKKIDGLYILIYLSVLLVWPYPNEMDRFLIPIIPLIIMYAFFTLDRLSSKFSSSNIFSIIFTFSLIFFASPSLVHIYERYHFGNNQFGENISSIIELYEGRDVDEAVANALIIKKNIEIIKSSTNLFKSDDVILSIKPRLFTYLSGVYAEELPRVNGILPDEYLFNLWLTYIKQTNATHILLLPIKLSPEFNEIDAVPYLSEDTEKIFSYGYVIDNREKSTLAILRIL